jgi:hypothetical protein
MKWATLNRLFLVGMVTFFVTLWRSTFMETVFRRRRKQS